MRVRRRAFRVGRRPGDCATAGEVLITLRADEAARFVEKLDFQPRAAIWKVGQRENEVSGKGPTAVITDLGIMTSRSGHEGVKR